MLTLTGSVLQRGIMKGSQAGWRKHFTRLQMCADVRYGVCAGVDKNVADLGPPHSQ